MKEQTFVSSEVPRKLEEVVSDWLKEELPEILRPGKVTVHESGLVVVQNYAVDTTSKEGRVLYVQNSDGTLKEDDPVSFFPKKPFPLERIQTYEKADVQLHGTRRVETITLTAIFDCEDPVQDEAAFELLTWLHEWRKSNVRLKESHESKSLS